MQAETLDNGEMDYDHLRKLLTKNSSKPAIINVNVGTTVKGAVDNLDTILSILSETGYKEDRFYIHCDGALFGLMVSFPLLFCVFSAHYFYLNSSQAVGTKVIISVWKFSL